MWKSTNKTWTIILLADTINQPYVCIYCTARNHENKSARIMSKVFLLDSQHCFDCFGTSFALKHRKLATSTFKIFSGLRPEPRGRGASPPCIPPTHTSTRGLRPRVAVWDPKYTPTEVSFYSTFYTVFRTAESSNLLFL